MTSTIIKVDPEVDLYAQFESITESFVQWGPRSFLMTRGVAAERLDRADEYGSSALWGGHRWDDDVLIYQQQGILRRANMTEALDRLERDDQADIRDLLDPFDDE